MHRHPYDVISLIAGLVFTGFAIAYIIGAYTDARLDPRLAFPVALVGLGIAGLAGSLLAQRRNDREVSSSADDV